MANGARLALLLVLAFAAPAAAAPAPAYLVKDLNTAAVEESDSAPLRFVTRDGVAYFTADDGLHGTELWRSDGTAAGTRMVADIDPGNESSNPRDLTVIGDAVWFRAWDGRHGCGVWRSDGSEAGTQNVAVVHTSLPNCFNIYTDGTPAGFIQINDTVFFVADTDGSGRELWRSDGTAAGTRLVADIFPGFEGSDPRALTVLDGILYFFADDGIAGYELWRTDGTADGTHRVRDVNPGPGDGMQSGRTTGRRRAQMAVVNGALLFAGYDDEHGVELWRSDGTEDGTTLLVDTEPGTAVGGLGVGLSGPTPFAPLGDDTIFFSLHADPPPARLMTWRSDGSAAGTVPIGEISPLLGPGGPTVLTPVGDAVYFSFGGELGVGLWRADGTGVAPLATLNAHGDQVGELTAVGSQLLFFAPDLSGGCGLWRTDRTSGATQLVRAGASVEAICPDDVAIAAPGMHIGRVGDRVLFAASEPGRGRELFSSDGTTAGTHLVLDVNDATGRTQDAVISFADGGVLGNVLLFAASGGPTEPVQVWRSDGTADGTMPVVPVSPAGGGAVGGRFVLAGIEDSGAALWSTDGTPAGATRIQAIRPGPWQVTATDAALFLTLADDETGSELWRSDGTIEGTFRVRDLTPGPGGTEFGLRTPFAGGLAFVVQRNAGDELWFSDGSDAGTHLVTALQGDDHRIRNLLDVDGVLYFDVGGFSAGGELWRSDGTPGGTTRVIDLSAGVEPVTAVWLAAGPGALFFAAADDATGVELWRSDGTAGGTGRVRDVFPGPDSALLDPDGALVQRTARAGNALLFVADDGAHGPEVWRSDGSEAGTALLRDIDPRDRALIDDFALPLVPVGERVVFAPRDADAGVEPWISDGTDAGTRRLADIAPGPLSGLRQGATFAVTGTHVFMEADDGVHGRELWAIRRAALDGGPVCAGDCNGDARVGIEELVRGVGIALGSTAADVCPAFDRDGDGMVSIAELIAAVGAALNGCPGSA